MVKFPTFTCAHCGAEAPPGHTCAQTPTMPWPPKPIYKLASQEDHDRARAVITEGVDSMGMEDPEFDRFIHPKLELFFGPCRVICLSPVDTLLAIISIIRVAPDADGLRPRIRLEFDRPADAVREVLLAEVPE